MTDVGTTTTATATREAVADRKWIDAAGNEAEADAATGFRYLDLATQKAFVWQSGHAAGTALTMLAIFGGLTKAGNIRNTLVNGPKGDPNADVIGGIQEWFDELDNGTWAADRVGGGGMRFNAEALSRAIATAKGEHDHSAYLAKITSRLKVKDPGDKNGKKEILYATLAYRNPVVKEHYHKLLPADSTAPSLGDL